MITFEKTLSVPESARLCGVGRGTLPADYLQKPINFHELLLRLEKIRNYNRLIKNAHDLREAMDVTEQNASQTIQDLEMVVVKQENALSEIRQVV